MQQKNQNKILFEPFSYKMEMTESDDDGRE
jgi:hypothetical protein